MNIASPQPAVAAAGWLNASAWPSLRYTRPTRYRVPITARALVLAVVALSFASVSALTAQVNTEVFRPTGQDEGTSGSFSFTFAARRGNSESDRAGLGVRLFRAHPFLVDEVAQAKRPVTPELLSPQRLLLLIAEYDFEDSRGDTTVNRGFAHLRWTQMWKPRLGWEVFGQIETDEFTRLDRRTLLGVGLRYGAYQRKRATMFLGIGMMGEWERIEERGTVASADPLGRDTRNVVRVTSYFNARWQHANERVEMSTTTYVQPAADDIDDYRILSQARLSTSVTSRLSMDLLVNIRHDSMPPAEIDQTDIEIKAGLSFKF